LPVGKKGKIYNWHQIDVWAFRSSDPITIENKATDAIADTHIFYCKNPDLA
jgi:hypothetical protein